MTKLIFLTLTLLLSCFSKANVIEGYDVSKSWEKAIVYVPGNLFTKTVGSVKVEKPMSVVILLHGCGGIHEHEKRWAETIKSAGFIVVLPNSFAIPNREVNCVSETSTANIGKVPVNDLRPAEAEYAGNKINEMEWVDKNNIFLMGHSEGGMGAFYTKEVGFKGVIVSGFPCRSRKPVGSGHGTPFLAINWERDPYFDKNNNPYIQCSDKPFWKRRIDANQLVLPGKGHATAYERQAVDTVLKFLKERISK